MGWVGFSFTGRRQERIGGILITLVFLGVGYSIVKGFDVSGTLLQGYLSGKTLLTPLHNDRVRFSWLVVAVLFWIQLQWVAASKNLRRLYLFLSVFFILYLHVLAVRIGLLCFYMAALFFLLRAIVKPVTHIRAALLLLLLIAFPVIMYQIGRAHV